MAKQKKKKTLSMAQMFDAAVQQHGENTVISAISHPSKSMEFNGASEFRTFIEDGNLNGKTLDFARMNYIRNALKKLTKQVRGNKYAEHSKIEEAAPSSDIA